MNIHKTSMEIVKILDEECGMIRKGCTPYPYIYDVLARVNSETSEQPASTEQTNGKICEHYQKVEDINEMAIPIVRHNCLCEGKLHHSS